MSKILKQEISIIEKRKAQAEVIKPIFEEMVSTLGKTKAKKILKNANYEDFLTRFEKMIQQDEISIVIAKQNVLKIHFQSCP